MKREYKTIVICKKQAADVLFTWRLAWEASESHKFSLGQSDKAALIDNN